MEDPHAEQQCIYTTSDAILIIYIMDGGGASVDATIILIICLGIMVGMIQPMI